MPCILTDFSRLVRRLRFLRKRPARRREGECGVEVEDPSLKKIAEELYFRGRPFCWYRKEAGGIEKCLMCPRLLSHSLKHRGRSRCLRGDLGARHGFYGGRHEEGWDARYRGETAEG
jgi:hypothetical protein